MIQHNVGPLDGLTYYTQGLLAWWPQKAAVSAAVAGCTQFFGGDVVLFWLVCAMWGADLSFGLIEAVRRGRFHCRLFARGVLKLPTYCLYLALVGAVSISCSRALGARLPLLDMFCAYLLATDAVSVMGHMIRLGMPVPRTLRRVILRSQAKIQHSVETLLDNEDSK